MEKLVAVLAVTFFTAFALTPASANPQCVTAPGTSGVVCDIQPGNNWPPLRKSRRPADKQTWKMVIAGKNFHQGENGLINGHIHTCSNVTVRVSVEKLKFWSTSVSYVRDLEAKALLAESEAEVLEDKASLLETAAVDFETSADSLESAAEMLEAAAVVKENEADVAEADAARTNSDADRMAAMKARAAASVARHSATEKRGEAAAKRKEATKARRNAAQKRAQAITARDVATTARQLFEGAKRKLGADWPDKKPQVAVKNCKRNEMIEPKTSSCMQQKNQPGQGAKPSETEPGIEKANCNAAETPNPPPCAQAVGCLYAENCPHEATQNTPSAATKPDNPTLIVTLKHLQGGTHVREFGVTPVSTDPNEPDSGDCRNCEPIANVKSTKGSGHVGFSLEASPSCGTTEQCNFIMTLLFEGTGYENCRPKPRRLPRYIY